MQSSVKDKHYTPEEYFLLEQTGEIRHEFINGNIYKMSEASREHHKICKKLLSFLKLYFHQKGMKFL
ncbi:MAG: Uma2 family endonuclease [Parafilimonas sp.]